MKEELLVYSGWGMGKVSRAFLRQDAFHRRGESPQIEDLRGIEKGINFISWPVDTWCIP